MDKNTKILLGVGAVIAAYLILKPKKVAAETGLVSLKKSPTSNGIIDNNDEVIPKSPYMPQVIESTPEEMNRYYAIMERLRESKKRDCATPMAIGYSSYFDEALGRCVTEYTKPTYGAEKDLTMAQLGDLTNWA